LRGGNFNMGPGKIVLTQYLQTWFVIHDQQIP
jgi:hypothetical protein